MAYPRGSWSGRIGISSYAADGDPMSAADFEAEMTVVRALARGLAKLLGPSAATGSQIAGTKFSSGSSVPAGAWVIFDNDGFPHYRETGWSTPIYAGASGTSMKLYAVLKLEGGISPDLIDSDLDAIEFWAYGLSDPAPSHSLLLGQGTGAVSGNLFNFTSFTWQSGAYQVSLDDIAGFGLEYDVNGRLAVDAGDLAGTGLEEHTNGTLRIASSAAGFGLNGGSGSALEVDLSEITGDGLTVSSDKIVVLPDGTSLSVSSSGVTIAMGGVEPAHLSSGVSGRICQCSITAGAENADVRRITVQFKGAAGENISSPCGAIIWLSDTDYSAVLTSVSPSAWSSIIGNQSFIVTNKYANFATGSTGYYQFDLTISGSVTIYILVSIGGRIYSSGALSWT
jgi:hypothetical protein